MSPSREPGSWEDFSSLLSNGLTLPGTPNVAMIVAATRYMRSFSRSPFSSLKISLFNLTRLILISCSRFCFNFSSSSGLRLRLRTFSIKNQNVLAQGMRDLNSHLQAVQRQNCSCQRSKRLICDEALLWIHRGIQLRQWL